MPDSKTTIQELVNKYQALTNKERAGYNEANTSNVFIRPLFEALGWDFSDIESVEAEKTILKGRVDYLLKVKTISKFCLEIKSLKNELTDDNRRQAIEYAYNKGETWAILTNFDRIMVFNAEIKTEDLKVAQLFDIHFKDYITDFEQLNLLSKDSAAEDRLDEIAEKFSKVARRMPVEKRLFGQLSKWREDLFNHVYQFNIEKGVTQNQTDLLIEKLFSRLIFIRAAEDRGLAGNHPLLSALHQWENTGKKEEDLLNRIKSIFKDFVQTFDSELFPVIDIWQQLWINDYLLAEIIAGLYEVKGDFARYDFRVIEPDVFGQVYEQYLGYVAKSLKDKPKIQPVLFSVGDEQKFEFASKMEKRKKGGIYYTPKWVTDYIVKNTINKYLSEHTYEENRNVKILDPACGSGSFLIRAYDALLQYHANIKSRPVAELSWSERMGILTRNIFGVDLDLQAVEIARLNLLIRALAQRESLPSLVEVIRHRNSLIFGTNKQLENWYGKDYQNLNPVDWQSVSNKGFDIVIGNPPYVMELRDNKEIFRQLKLTEFGGKYYEPKMDIFYYFMELGIDLLKPGGYLGFIVQEYWVSRAHASKLRGKVFNETHPLILVDLKDFKVFQDATGQHNMITILKKSKENNSETLTMQLKNSDVSEKQIIKALASNIDAQDLFETRTVETTQLYDLGKNKVYITSNGNSTVLEKLSINAFVLDTKEIQQGLVTPQHSLTAKTLKGLTNQKNHSVGEGIFVLSKAEFNRYKFTEEEKVILKPFHFAEELDRYFYKLDTGYFIIYTSSEVAKYIEANPKKYPNIKSHLDEYQAVITSSNKPYGIHRARQPEWFDDTAKIVSVRKTLYPKFTVIPEPWYGDQAVQIIRLIKHKQFSPMFIAAILNSKVGHFWLFQQKTQGNQLQVDKEVLLNFPFPNLNLNDTVYKQRYNEIVSLANKIAKSKRRQEQIKNSALGKLDEEWGKVKNEIIKNENQIDQIVFSIYDLSEKEANQVENVIKEFSWSEQKS